MAGEEIKLWDMDKCVLKPGLAAQELNRLLDREGKLLAANSRLFERARAAEGLLAYYKGRLRWWKAAAGRAIESDGKHRFTFLEMEAALCVWEWIIEATDASRPWPTIDVKEWRDAIGTVAARNASISIGRYCLRVYAKGKEIAGPEAWDDVPFDWEVIPAICSQIRFRKDGVWEAPTYENAARAALKRVANWHEEEAPVAIPELIIMDTEARD